MKLDILGAVTEQPTEIMMRPELYPRSPEFEKLDRFYFELPIIAVLSLLGLALAFTVFAFACGAWALYDVVAA